MKTCNLCKKSMPIDCFYAHSRMADGYLNRCKDCHKAAIRAKRAERVGHYREYDRKRARNPERVKAAAEISAAWRAEDSRRMACHNAVARAVRSGRLIRKPCVRCGSEKSMAHHESYDRKLDVTWLCQPCHKQRHKEMVQLGIAP